METDKERINTRKKKIKKKIMEGKEMVRDS